MQEKTIYIITGPTASGKTSLAIALAKHLDTAIISADSRQCFKELNIGVAKPAAQELSEVPHFFINQFHISEELSARLFEEQALAFTRKIFEKKQFLIMAGGTGLYIKAFCEGLDEVPDIDNTLRQNLRSAFEEKGLVWLQQEIRKKDPAFWEQAERMNPQRLLRALEVKEQTGQSLLKYQAHKKTKRDFKIIKIGIDLPRKLLYNNINARVDHMMQQGLLEEVKQLLPYRALPALRTVGYNELFAYLDGECTLDEAVEKIKQHTRNYAKRQLTWFRKDIFINWVKGNQLHDLTGLRLEK